MSNKRDDDIDKLNSFLRGELSATETYRQAMEKLDDDPALKSELERCRQSHAGRTARLRAEIASLGGKPSETSGAWGAFAKLVEGGAKLFGKQAALAVLEEGEDHGLKDYRESQDELTPHVREFVSKSLLPEQQITHQAMNRLQKQV